MTRAGLAPVAWAAVATSFGSIDEYIASCPAEVRDELEAIRQTIHRAAPEAVEAISYQLPTFKLDGTNLVHFGAWKHHLALYPLPTGTKAFQRRLAPYVAGKGTVRFPLGEPVPHDLVEAIVGFHVKERAKPAKR